MPLDGARTAGQINESKAERAFADAPRHAALFGCPLAVRQLGAATEADRADGFFTDAGSFGYLGIASVHLFSQSQNFPLLYKRCWLGHPIPLDTIRGCCKIDHVKSFSK